VEWGREFAKEHSGFRTGLVLGEWRTCESPWDSKQQVSRFAPTRCNRRHDCHRGGREILREGALVHGCQFRWKPTHCAVPRDAAAERVAILSTNPDGFLLSVSIITGALVASSSVHSMT
jgi:hypothetical protein